MIPISNIAALHDLASYGRCSLTCVIPILSCMGYKVCPIPTAIYSSDTGDFGPVYALELTDAMHSVIDKLRTLNVKIDAIYSGYLGSPTQADVVLSMMHHFPALDLVDPVMGDMGKLYSAITPDMVDAMRALIHAADLITPNLTEACFLLGYPCTPDALTVSDARDMLAALKSKTSGTVVITSAPLLGHPDAVCTIAQGDDSPFALLTPRMGGHYPGTGDIFASVLLGHLLRKEPLQAAIAHAAHFVAYCMQETQAYATPAREGVLLEHCLSHLHAAPVPMQVLHL